MIQPDLSQPEEHQVLVDIKDANSNFAEEITSIIYEKYMSVQKPYFRIKPVIS